MCVFNLTSTLFQFIVFSFFPFLRHPPGHVYFDPDFLEGIQQDIEREELEYEVKTPSPFLVVHSMKLYFWAEVHYCSISRPEVVSASPLQWPC